MPRPFRTRRIGQMPGTTFFKPAGARINELEEVVLTNEEYESLRLKDVEELDQNSCAEKMDVSQPTFNRVLNSARKKISDAIVNGKAIRIEGGNYEFVRGYGRGNGQGLGRGLGLGQGRMGGSGRGFGRGRNL